MNFDQEKATSAISRYASIQVSMSMPGPKHRDDQPPRARARTSNENVHLNPFAGVLGYEIEKVARPEGVIRFLPSFISISMIVFQVDSWQSGCKLAEG